MYIVSLAILLIFTVSESNNCLLPEFIDDKPLYSPAAQIAKHNFFSHYATLIWSNDIEDNSLESFFQQYDGHVLQEGYNGVTKRQYSKERQSRSVTQYVIYFSNIEDFEYFLEVSSVQRTLFNSGKFIITCIDDVNSARCNLKHVFDICWKYYVVNVVLIHQNKSENITLFTYFPMSEGRCDNTEPKLLGKISKKKKHQVSTELFPNKFYNFNGCPLIVSLLESDRHITALRDDRHRIRLSGIEGSIYPVLAETLNASLNVLFPANGYGEFNGTSWSGMLGDLFFKRANMSSFCFRLKSYDESFRAAFPFRTLTMGWATPPIPLKPLWIKLIYPFDYILRILVATFLIFICITLVLLRTTKVLNLWDSYFSWYSIKDNIYMETCAIFLGQVASGQPTNVTSSLMFVLWLWFSFIIRNSYQGALVGSLKKDYYRSDLDSFLGFINAGYEFGGPMISKEFFLDDSQLYQMYKVMSDTDLDAQLDLMANGSVKLIYHTTMDKVAIYNLMANGTKYLHAIDNDIIWRPLANYFPTDSPLVEVIDTLHGRIQSSGIELKFGAQLEQIRKEAHTIYRPNIKQGYALTMHHMFACLLLVAAGWVLSISLFLLELCWENISNRLLIRKNKLKLDKANM